MNEQDRGEPQRSLETTLALHGVISTISERMTQKGALMYNGNFKTNVRHAAAFPKNVCDGFLKMIYMDNEVQYANFECTDGCYEEARKIMMSDFPEDGDVSKIDESKVFKERNSIYTINFDEVGFVAKGKEKDAKQPGIVIPQGRPQLSDEDLQDLIEG